jgi:hypothetical protein
MQHMVNLNPAGKPEDMKNSTTHQISLGGHPMKPNNTLTSTRLRRTGVPIFPCTPDEGCDESVERIRTRAKFWSENNLIDQSVDRWHNILITRKAEYTQLRMWLIPWHNQSRDMNVKKFTNLALERQYTLLLSNPSLTYSPVATPIVKMSGQNTILHSNGEILTGRLWRKSHSFFKDLPFYSNIVRMDEMTGALVNADDDGRERCYKTMLFVCSFVVISPLESDWFW